MLAHLAAILAAVLVIAPASPYLNIPIASVQPLQIPAGGPGEPNRTICTTFSISERDKMWGTAAHCVLQQDDEGNTHARINLLIGGKPTVVMHANALLDVAVLRAEVSAPAVKLGKRPAIGDVVRVYGYMWGDYSPTIFKGEIASLNIDGDGSHYVIFDMRVGPGHSGSPVFDVTGEVVSVMQVSSLGFSGGALYGYLDELLPYWN